MSVAALDQPAAPRPRSRIVAALLSLIAPGVGHLYVGQWRRAALIFAALIVAIPVFVAIAHLIPPRDVPLLIFAVGWAALIGALYIVVAADAARLARREPVSPRPSWLVLIGALLLVLGANYALGHALPLMKSLTSWRTFTVASGSMRPTLHVNEWVLGDTHYYATHEPARGDVVFYRYPADETTIYVKRVIGLPGDRVAFRDNHAVVNGTMTSEPFADFGDANAYYATTAEVTVPAGQLFVAGDNRANSSDSRMTRHGTVPVGNLVARATEIMMSTDWGRFGTWVGTPN